MIIVTQMYFFYMIILLHKKIHKYDYCYTNVFINNLSSTHQLINNFISNLTASTYS
jgi:hypothetical protein